MGHLRGRYCAESAVCQQATGTRFLPKIRGGSCRDTARIMAPTAPRAPGAPRGLRFRFLDRMHAGLVTPQLREFRVLPQPQGEDGRPAVALLEGQARVLMGELLILVGEAANGSLQSQH